MGILTRRTFRARGRVFLIRRRKTRPRSHLTFRILLASKLFIRSFEHRLERDAMKISCRPHRNRSLTLKSILAVVLLPASLLAEPVPLKRIVELMSSNPAKLVGLIGRGSLSSGAHADLTIFDPAKKWKFETQDSRSKSKNTPFDGWEFTGAVTATIVSGKIVYHRDRKSR